MNNLLSHCGLVDARISASEKDLPVWRGMCPILENKEPRYQTILEAWLIKSYFQTM